MTTTNQPTTTKEALEPCPLCRKPLTELTNGLAYCHNLKTDSLSVDDWIAESCPLAQHNVQLPVKVWHALNSRASAPIVAPEVDEWQPIETAPKDGTHILIGTFRDPAPIGFGWCGKPAKHQPWQAVVHFWDGAGEEGFYLSTGDRGGAPLTGTHWKALTEPKDSKHSQTTEGGRYYSTIYTNSSSRSENSGQV